MFFFPFHFIYSFTFAKHVSTAQVLSNKIVGLYFSAHWCGPCRAFTPMLAQTYDIVRQSGRALEIVFVSSDRDLGSFSEYFNQMPWLALPFENRSLKVSWQLFNARSCCTVFIVSDK
jgi:thiol-disulfide isomerase/thioredoxin